MSTALALLEDLDDCELMRRVKADDPHAFGVLHDRFAARAHRVVWSVTRRPARVEDVYQEAFLSVWRSRDRYDPDKGSVSAWMMGVVRNRAIDSLRVNGRHDERRAHEEWAQDDLPALGDTARDVEERDEAATLRRALTRLPDAQREVITLAYFGELTATEIAAELSLPLGTVKGRMRLGLSKLRGEVCT